MVIHTHTLLKLINDAWAYFIKQDQGINQKFEFLTIG